MKRDIEMFSRLRSSLRKIAIVAYYRYFDDELNLQAMGLTYRTLLSLVPFLAVTFSVLKAFGAHNTIEPVLSQILQPLGPEAAQITKRITEFVENIRVGVLGGVGLAMLFYTVVMLMASVEDAFNQIWRLPRSRTWGQRISIYLTLVLVGPVMVFTAIALMASAQSYWLVDRLAEIGLVSDAIALLTSLMPFVLLCAAFTFLYWLLPNTRVRFSSALIAGATAGILWQLAGSALTAFIANSAQYAAIYSSFAVMIVFLIWLYVGWLILLIGAEVAYFHQHPYALEREAQHKGRGHLFREWLALSVAAEVTRRYLAGKPPCQPSELAALLGVASLGNVITDLVQAGILLRSAEPEGVAPARPPEDVPVKEVLDVLAGSTVKELKSGPAAEVLVRRDEAVQKALDGLTLKSLAVEPQQPRAKVLRSTSANP